MGEYTAMLYVIDFLKTDPDVFLKSFSMEEIIEEINRAPLEVKQFFNQLCPTVNDLEEYLSSHEEYFCVENGRVAINYPSVREGRDKIVPYFEDILDTYTEPPHYEHFYGHIGQADPDIQCFFRLFYPDFRQFLLNHPDVFVVFDNDTVSLIENESVSYFQQCIREGREGWYYRNLRGCIGQAPNHVIDFINEYYQEEDFLQFLKNNSDAFDVDEEGYVYLN